MVELGLSSICATSVAAVELVLLPIVAVVFDSTVDTSGVTITAASVEVESVLAAVAAIIVGLVCDAAVSCGVDELLMASFAGFVMPSVAFGKRLLLFS